ncbi:mitochondrial escape protein 2 [Agyrium rufum]|nr:mitochondrial escape protein 2 [Agyrium rufum]
MNRQALASFKLMGNPSIRLLCANNHARFTSSASLVNKGARQDSRNVRRASTEAGENKSGHINAGQNEGIFFLDNIFPLKLHWIKRIPMFRSDEFFSSTIQRPDKMPMGFPSPIDIVKQSIPQDLPITVKEIFPRLKEGGAYVKFSHDNAVSNAELESHLRKYLKENPIKPWFNPWRRVRSFLVVGKPWLEDLYRFPSTKLRVEFIPTKPGAEAAELSQETLYTLFRRYGKLAEIESQPSDSKALPKYAYLSFRLSRQAIMAKNCMHGYTLPAAEGGGETGTVLKLGYERTVKAHWIRDWILNHPRVVIPIVLALIGAVSITIFDPIRTLFIKLHVTRQFHIGDSMITKWLRGVAMRAGDILTLRSKTADDAGLKVIWDDRKDDIEQIQKWLMETADTFVVVQGPRGSGKRELVLDQALEGRKNQLVVDCKPIQEAHGDSATINAAAKEVGYRPIFSWMNSMNSLIDLAAQGTIGTKTGFSETLDSQLAKIWQNTATALKQVALEGRQKGDKDANLSDDEYLEAHPEKRPVVVIDNFLHKSNENSLVYDKISEWAAQLTTANIAHVIFLTSDVSFSKSLSKALPDRVFRSISLGDCSPEVAKRFVMNHLDADKQESGDDAAEKPGVPQMREDLAELDECIETLGGRLTDLEFLARRVKAGQAPKRAVQEIIDQSASEILKMYILDIDPAARKWTPQQAWLLIKSLAATSKTPQPSKANANSTTTQPGNLRYNEILLSDTFKSSGDAVLQALETAELITIHSPEGRPHSISAGKPVYLAAFRKLVQDEVLRARLDLALLGELVTLENKNVEKFEGELQLLGGLPHGGGRELEPRVRWLVGKMAASQEKVEGWEREMGGLKEVLKMKY